MKLLRGIRLAQQKKNLIIRLLRIKVKKRGYKKGYIHSVATLNFRNFVFNKMVSYLEHDLYVKSITEIDAELLLKFLISFSKTHSVSQKYLINILSTISSTFRALKSQGIYIEISDDEFDEIRATIKNNFINTQKKNRAVIIKDIEKVDNYIVKNLVKTQYKLGVRIDELFQIKKEFIYKDQDGYYIKEGTIIGKGGYKIIRKYISKELATFLLIVLRKNNKLPICKSIYNKYLKIHLKETSHAIRYNFAQDLNQKLNSKALNKHSKDKEIARELGHHRPSSANRYSAV